MDKIKIPKGYRVVRETKTEKIALTVLPEVKEMIKAEAAEQGISVNEFFNRMLNDRYGFKNEIDFVE